MTRGAAMLARHHNPTENKCMKKTALASLIVAASTLWLAGCLDGSSSSNNNAAPAPGETAPDTRVLVLPYLQNPTDTAISVIWFTDTDVAGELVVDGVGSFTSEPELVEALGYGDSEVEYIHGERNFGGIHADVAAGQAPALPYRHLVRVEGLSAATTYEYQVRQPGSETLMEAQFTTAPAVGERASIRFLAMSDMETEPESTEKTVAWGASALPVGGDKLGTDPGTYDRMYPVDQTTGYRANIRYAMERQPDFWVIAGDLVEKGGRQLDWDEFWRHAAGEWSDFASSTPIFPALGNHENYWHPEGGSYSPPAVMRSYDKWSSYWELPRNYGTDERYEKRFYRVDYGPVTLITLDSSNGDDSDPLKDTNLAIDGVQSRVPDFNRGSEQWNWAVSELADAKAQGQVIFVQFHHTPFGTGVHSLPSGSAGIPNNEDSQSGQPMRIYHELFDRYGVTAVLAGHDELLEYVQMDGVHYWDVGFAGDGLRGPGYAPTTDYVPFDQLPAEAQETHWSAHGDAPEIWSGNQLVDGGKHYGFLEVEVRPAGSHDYEVIMTPRYAFPLMDEQGVVTGEFAHRQYNKVVRVQVER
ncbi:FN3 domain-containing metallophosphoesterase family protein [Pseudomonas sp. FME51]|uniref:FN3 domain-containing metallophosphoesterase family protein n=1 Tax=Pseudomonas sp. FME51 TaxID=2742609 RepID=UPI001D003D53|nr:FN3 domain-containing metallophosphoesterase family protein [Pseudomonas sp. FME51]